MDTSSPFNESFSYAWLSDGAHGDGDGVGVGVGGGGSFIEMDPDFFSMRWSADSKHFDLNLVPSRGGADATALTRSQSACSTKPLMATVSSSSQRCSPLFHSAQSTPTAAKRGGAGRVFFFRRCAKSPKNILWKYLCFLLPLCRKAKDQLHVLAPNPARGSCSSSAAAAAKKASSTFSSIEWCRGNADSAVYDAILYCKRSIGQDIMEK